MHGLLPPIDVIYDVDPDGHHRPAILLLAPMGTYTNDEIGLAIAVQRELGGVLILATPR